MHTVIVWKPSGVIIFKVSLYIIKLFSNDKLFRIKETSGLQLVLQNTRHFKEITPQQKAQSMRCYSELDHFDKERKLTELF